jgi:hypothetical protein
MKRNKTWKPEVDRIFVTWTAIERGLFMYLAYVPNTMSPVGLCWGELSGGGKKRTFESMGSFVPTWARRFGVRTAINKTILTHASTIITKHGSKDGGRAFLKASGYKWDSNTNHWYLKKSA